MRGLYFILACAMAAPAMAQQPDSMAGVTLQVSLDEAVRRALLVQPAMVQSEGDRRNAAAGLRSAFGAFLPSFNTSASASRSNQSRIDFTTGQPIPPQYTYTVGLSANLDLFAGFRRFANIRSASANTDAADAGVTNQRFQVTLQTKQTFYNALAQEDLVQVAQAQLARAQQQLDISVQKLHAGSATRSDSLRSAVDLGNARLALLQAQADLATAQANLGRQIGVDAPVRAIPDSALPAMPDTGVLRTDALQTAPLVVQADAQSRAAAAGVWSARSQYFPSLTVSYNDNRQGTGPLFNNPETFGWRFGLSWTLFNGGSREQQQVAAKVQRDVAKARSADTRRQVNAQLTQEIAALGTAYLQIGIATENVAAATEDLRVNQERYRVGAGTILDLLTSQASLTQAQTNQVQARYNYNIALAQLEATVGHPL